jgi:hypothetical protein
MAKSASHCNFPGNQNCPSVWADFGYQLLNKHFQIAKKNLMDSLAKKLARQGHEILG